MKKSHLIAASAVLLAALFAAYENHWHNSLHFDDWHTVIQNQSIRHIRPISRFFTDATTISVQPQNQAYRPVLTLSLALDFALSRGVDPKWFHISTFFWYLVLLASMYLLFVRLATAETALMSVALFGLHPVSAETVNYVVQRSEIYSTLGVVAALAIYIYRPGTRRFGLYLVPAIIGALAKPLTLMFPAILFFYLVVYEEAGWLEALRKCMPSGVFAVAMGLFQTAMTPKTYVTGGTNVVRYWMTQPIVILHYVKTFFLPTELSADTDRALVKSIWSEPAVIGIAFLALFAWTIFRACQDKDMRPTVFGMMWFLIALAPTSIPTLGEVENDHRMFFPFVGLTLAVVWAASRYLNRKWFLAAGGVALVACAIGTHVRNEAWLSEETLWKDVTEKSPLNARGWVNYGIAHSQRGDFVNALTYYRQAEALKSEMYLLKLQMGIAYGMVGEHTLADSYFRAALPLAPLDAQARYLYARYLKQAHRIPEATAMLHDAMELNPRYVYSRYLLMQIMGEQGDLPALRAFAEDTLKLFPGDPIASAYLAGTVPPAADEPEVPVPS